MTGVAHKAAARDLASVADTLGRAFQADPVMTWLLPDPERRRSRLAPFFATVMAEVHASHDLVFRTDDFSGGAVWDPPDGWSVGLLAQARMAPSMVRLFGGGVLRLLSLLSLIEKRHLREPHYYLAQLGTDPAHQGRGIGSALLAPMLARCDAEQMPAYLESSNLRNVPFYMRQGFETTGTIELKNGPPLTLMRRPPRGGGGARGA
jgi:ribosomal protein S18 acetylase RimI-like enzyme